MRRGAVARGGLVVLTTLGLAAAHAAPGEVAPGEVAPGADARDADARDADPEALWDAARVARDRDHDPAAAAVILRRLVARHPDSRPAERARAALDWIEARDPVAAADLLALQGPQPREGRWLQAHRGTIDAPLVAVRHALKLDEAEAIELLEAHQHDPRWGFVVQRAIAQRLFFDGRYVAALQSAEVAGDVGRRGAAVRMLAWRAAAGLAGALVLAVGWLIWRRRRRRKRRR